jgi:hypothetical protein
MYVGSASLALGWELDDNDESSASLYIKSFCFGTHIELPDCDAKLLETDCCENA